MAVIRLVRYRDHTCVVTAFPLDCRHFGRYGGGETPELTSVPDLVLLKPAPSHLRTTRASKASNTCRHIQVQCREWSPGGHAPVTGSAKTVNCMVIERGRSQMPPITRCLKRSPRLYAWRSGFRDFADATPHVSNGPTQMLTGGCLEWTLLTANQSPGMLYRCLHQAVLQ